MRPNLILILVAVAECFISINGLANYRSLVPTRRFQSNRRYKDYRTMNYKPSEQPNCRQYQPPNHSIRPRSIKNEEQIQCVRQRREKQWHNIAEVKRDLENNPPPPSTTTIEPSTEPPTPPKPKVKPQKGNPKKVQVEMVKITTIGYNNQEMQRQQMGPPSGYMGPPPGYMGPPPGYNGPPPGYMGPPISYGPAPPLGPIPRWTQNQGSPPPWAYEGRPGWAEPRRWTPPARPRQKPKDALDRVLSDHDMKKKNGGSDEKWPLKGDSDRHRWESREGSDIYWELESTKKLATWDPNKSHGPLWKAASKSSSGKKKWEDNLGDLNELKDEWKDSEHGGVPKPPLQYLREYRRP